MKIRQGPLVGGCRHERDVLLLFVFNIGILYFLIAVDPSWSAPGSPR